MKENIKNLLEHGNVIIKLRFYKSNKSSTTWIIPLWVKDNYLLYSTYEQNKKSWYEYYIIPKTHTVTMFNTNKQGMLFKTFKVTELQPKPNDKIFKLLLNKT